MRMAAAVWMKFRCELRSRWVSWLGLALLVGIVAGGVMVAAAGARRTASAPDRFQADLRGADLVLKLTCGKAGVNRPLARCHRAVAALPAVADAARISTFGAFVATDGGRSLQPDASDPCFSGPGDVTVAGDRAGRFGTTLNRVRLTEGRRADPGRADEVMIPKAMADRLHLHPSSRLRISMFDGADCLDAPEKWRAPMTVRVVGVGIAPGEVPPVSGMYLGLVHVTPAFVAREPITADSLALAVRLRDGATRRDVLDQARRLHIQASVTVDLDDIAESLARGVPPQAIALALFAALTALAGAVVLGQLLVRQAFVDSSDGAVLSALGMGRGDRTALGVVRAAFVGSVGAAIAVGTAVLASPVTPIGLARTLEPDPGLAFDPVVLVVGACATLGFSLLVSGATSWVISRRPATGGAGIRGRGSPIAAALGRAGAPPSVSSGARMAFERVGSRSTAPIATSIVAIALALFTVTAALTFGAGLDRLIGTPRLTGWNWDALWGVQVDGTSVPEAEIRAALLAQPEVEAFAAGTFFSPFPRGRQLRLGNSARGVSMFSFAGDSAVGPSVIRGRAPISAREILVGTETLDDLGLDVGDTVVGHGQAGSWDEPGAETSATFIIVGTGVLPFTERLGRGASMTLAGTARLNPDRGPDGVYLRLRPGARGPSVVAAVARRLGLPPSSDVVFIGLSGREAFAEVRDLEQVDRAPLLFAALMALMAAAVLVNVLLSAVRSRRADLAILRVLGFDRRRIRITVMTMSCAYVLLAVAIAIPLGIVAGRVAWLTFADRLRVVPEASVPWALSATVIVASVLVAMAIAVPVARRASARPPARSLVGE